VHHRVFCTVVFIVEQIFERYGFVCVPFKCESVFFKVARRTF